MKKILSSEVSYTDTEVRVPHLYVLLATFESFCYVLLDHRKPRYNISCSTPLGAFRSNLVLHPRQEHT